MNNDELLIVIKDMFEKTTNEIKSYVDEKINGQSVLIESLRNDIKAAAEGHDTLYRKTDTIDKKLDDKTNEIKADQV